MKEELGYTWFQQITDHFTVPTSFHQLITILYYNSYWQNRVWNSNLNIYIKWALMLHPYSNILVNAILKCTAHRFGDKKLMNKQTKYFLYNTWTAWEIEMYCNFFFFFWDKTAWKCKKHWWPFCETDTKSPYEVCSVLQGPHYSCQHTVTNKTYLFVKTKHKNFHVFLPVEKYTTQGVWQRFTSMGAHLLSSLPLESELTQNRWQI